MVDIISQWFLDFPCDGRVGTLGIVILSVIIYCVVHKLKLKNPNNHQDD